MRKIILCLAVTFITAVSYSQYIHKIKADTVLITNDACSAELNLENSTRFNTGWLYNTGNGKTSFRKLKAANGLTMFNDTTVHLGGNFIGHTTLNMMGNSFFINLGNGMFQPGGGEFRINSRRDIITSNNDLYVQSNYTGNTSFGSGAGSVFVENFWQPTAQITGGTYGNYVSLHKANMGGINLSGVTLYGFQSRIRAEQANQTFGNLYHYYASSYAATGAMSTLAMNTQAGLYVEALKLPNTANTYAIYTAGSEDSIYNAGPVKLDKYKNNATEDYVLSTDSQGNLKLKTVSGGGGAGYQFASITADQTSNSSTMINATGLSFAVDANSSYHFKFEFAFSNLANTGNGARFGLSVPASPAVFSATARIPTVADAAGGEIQGWITNSGDSVFVTAFPAIGTNFIGTIEGIIVTGATAGTVQMRFASENTTVFTLRRGSMVAWIKNY